MRDYIKNLYGDFGRFYRFLKPTNQMSTDPNMRSKIMKTRLSFFRALNPNSKNSGIAYIPDHKFYEIRETEMQDDTVGESIRKTFYRNDLNFFEGIEATCNILMGDHYDLDCNKHGQKGVLDYLIFPLIARKLIADTYLKEREKSYLTKLRESGTETIPTQLQFLNLIKRLD